MERDVFVQFEYCDGRQSVPSISIKYSKAKKMILMREFEGKAIGFWHIKSLKK